jgi:hypothetical protein
LFSLYDHATAEDIETFFYGGVDADSRYHLVFTNHADSGASDGVRVDSVFSGIATFYQYYEHYVFWYGLDDWNPTCSTGMGADSSTAWFTVESSQDKTTWYEVASCTLQTISDACYVIDTRTAIDSTGASLYYDFRCKFRYVADHDSNGTDIESLYVGDVKIIGVDW